MTGRIAPIPTWAAPETESNASPVMCWNGILQARMGWVRGGVAGKPILFVNGRYYAWLAREGRADE